MTDAGAAACGPATAVLDVVAGDQPAADVGAVLGWYLFTLMVIPSDLVVGAFGAAGRPATLIGACLLGWYLLARAHPGIAIDRGPQPVRLAAVILCCSVLASYVSANLSALTVTQTNAADRGLILLAGWLGTMLLTADGVAGKGRLAVLLRRIVLGATFMAVLGIAEFVTRSNLTNYVSFPGLTVHQQATDLMTRAGLIRADSTAAQPLEFSAVLTIALPLAIHQARYAGQGKRLRRWLQVAVITATIPMAVSRSAILGMLVVAVILIPTWPLRQRWRACFTVAAIPAGLWLFVPGLLASFTATFGQLSTDSSSTSRVSALSMSAPIIGAHPWFGVGLATFNPQTYFFVDDQFITSLIETGVAGLLALVIVFACGLHVTRRLRKAAPDRETRDLAWSLTASIAVAAISFASFDVLSFSIASSLFFLITGCAGAAWRLARAADEGEGPNSLPGPGAATRANAPATGPAPSHCRACVTAPFALILIML